ncbi:hypothetical protein NC653_026552 [Populus alba x Populus x berolinensis]|uniref:Uncharacterized protein n=1 Tax=Populus alba x Populus x berolinensis TaxID=444605 RepID=A0AAD6ME30_9ROSI|nr:hypothetical protein NC653_026552 [Populus alba x Populus x berolinensis]
MDGTNWRCVADGQGAKEDQGYKFTRENEMTKVLSCYGTHEKREVVSSDEDVFKIRHVLVFHSRFSDSWLRRIVDVRPVPVIYADALVFFANLFSGRTLILVLLVFP